MEKGPFKYKLAFIVPWFGPWPNWMPLTWESCRWNPDIDWIFFTDQKRTDDTPENVRIIPRQFGEFITDLYSRLEIEGNPRELGPYKLCDLKPCHGEAFADILAGYDFWGICDIDLVWGNIRAFYPDRLLDEYDILSSSRVGINGQCTFFRNTPLINGLFREIPHVMDRFREHRYCSVDEDLMNVQATAAEKKGLLKVLRRRLNASEARNHWDEWAEQLVLEDEGTLENFPPLTGPCVWKDGRVFHIATEGEMAFHHFHKGKTIYTRKAWSYPFWREHMTGMEFRLRDVKVHFKPGRTALRWKHYFTTRFGHSLWHWLRNPVKNSIDVAKSSPAIMATYVKLLSYRKRPAMQPSIS